ncbi:MMB_0454 family protein [[Acholeplasma] multilocale]|uniref:MMB_0454 family protein n=1 Tax=[Acholeplasma] multilocale TaxID=264638 RepID=UPI000400B675|nr:hypothetical protein [[Acholeplasma] multilocale]
MYISIERNTRGALDIERHALNKLIQGAVFNAMSVKKDRKVEVTTDLYHDNLLYVLVKIELASNGIADIVFEEKKISKMVEDIISQTLDIKPKNIAIAYTK